MENLNEERAVLAVNSGVTFLAAEKGDRAKKGIHLLNPNQVELERALDDALIDGYTVIWIHDCYDTYRKDKIWVNQKS